MPLQNSTEESLQTQQCHRSLSPTVSSCRFRRSLEPKLNSLTPLTQASLLVTFHTFFRCHRLATSNHLPTITWLGAQLRTNQSFYGHAQNTSPVTLTYSISVPIHKTTIVPDTQWFTPYFRISPKILTPYSNNAARKTVFKHLKSPHIMFSTAMFKNHRAIVTLLLLRILDLWLVIGCHVDVIYTSSWWIPVEPSVYVKTFQQMTHDYPSN